MVVAECDKTSNRPLICRETNRLLTLLSWLALKTSSSLLVSEMPTLELIMYSRISHNIQAKLECTYASNNVLPYTNELDVAAMRIKFNLNHSVDPVKIEVADPVATGLGLL